MKPILYEQTEKDFYTNGFGTLIDAITCTVTEERNGPYELEMVYPVTGIHYEEIRYDRIIYAVPADGKDPQPFQIYEITRPMDGKVTIKAEHISYRMSYIPVMPFAAETAERAISGLRNNACEKCPFYFYTDKTVSARFNVSTPASMRSLLGGMEGSIIDVYGGEWEFDVFKVHLWKARGKDNGVTIRYGKNLTDLRQEESIANVYTGIVPYWKGLPDEASEKEKVVTLAEKAVYAATRDNYPFSRTIPVDLTSKFEAMPTEAELREEAEKYVSSNRIGYPKVSLTVSFVPLWQTEEYKSFSAIEHVNLCDTVHIVFPKLNISTAAKVVKTVFNVLTERYESIELGDTKSTLSDSMQSIANSAGEAASSASRSYTDQVAYANNNIDVKLESYYTKTETDNKLTEAISSASKTSKTYTDEKAKNYYTKEQTDENLREISNTADEKAGKEELISLINKSEEEERISLSKVNLSENVDLTGSFSSSSDTGSHMKLAGGVLTGGGGNLDFSQKDSEGNERVVLTSDGEMVLSAAKLYVPGGYFDPDGFHKTAGNTGSDGSDQE